MKNGYLREADAVQNRCSRQSRGGQCCEKKIVKKEQMR
jgi:hypothetical protein